MTARTRPHPREWLGLVGWLFPRNLTTEAVATTVGFDAPPEAVWQRILLYEEVPLGPPLLLRVLLPPPVRTDGEKTRVGATIQCTYSGGDLLKRITVVEPPHLLRFDVIEQRLGIEGCINVLGGSYEIRADGDGSAVVLTTNYRGHLRPRRLWRPFERFLVHQMHGHILDGMRAPLPH